MASDRLGTEEQSREEDLETQYMIEKSLQEAQIETSSLDPDTSHNVCIFTAIRQGDEQALRELCARHPDGFRQRDSRGWIPLHQAAAQRNPTILQLTHTASGEGSVQCRTLLGRTPLFLAVGQGLIEHASFLLHHGAQPDTSDHDQDTPLVTAIRSDRTDLAELLLAHGCSVDRRGAHSRTALHEASRLGRAALVRLLLAAGAQPDPRSHYGLTPLALAAQGGHVEVVEILLIRGADILARAQDDASILFEACACGDPDLIQLLLEHGADVNVPKHTGHLPIHRTSHRGHLQAMELLIPLTSMEAVNSSGMSPLHSAAAGGHAHCIQALLNAGFDPNFMLQPWVRRNYDDERKSALFFAVSNNDVVSVKILLEGGAMPNQDPVKCLQVALRLGNHELINLLLRFGANVNYFSRVNTTHFPSALQYALTDEVILRMLCNYGYDVECCFDCPYGDRAHIPDGYEGWTDTVIKDTMFCEVITVYWLRHVSGQVVRIMLDYVDHVTLCSKLKSVLLEQKEWPDICMVQGNVRSLQHLCRLKIRQCLGRLRIRAPVFMSFLPLPDRLKNYIQYREYDLSGLQSSTAG